MVEPSKFKFIKAVENMSRNITGINRFKMIFIVLLKD